MEAAPMNTSTMNTPTPWQIDLIPWFIFAAYWAITALRVKRAKAAETSSDRLATIAVLCVAYALLFYNWPRIPWLQFRFMPSSIWIQWAGVALTSIGVAVAVWARRTLGEFWSARVTLKEEHRLIRSGPYRFVRHPIYTGMFLAAAGTAVVVGEWRGVLALVLMLITHSRKALREEKMLTQEFGDEYAAYRQSTGFLFPRFRMSRP
jgi:protein-S-isoprenylcysteine O-methyltransferase Ste14